MRDFADQLDQAGLRRVSDGARRIEQLIADRGPNWSVKSSRMKLRDSYYDRELIFKARRFRNLNKSPKLLVTDVLMAIMNASGSQNDEIAHYKLLDALKFIDGVKSKKRAYESLVKLLVRDDYKRDDIEEALFQIAPHVGGYAGPTSQNRNYARAGIL